MKIKKICCIGAGYVGGPTMAVIADRCREIEVTVVDLNEDRIAAWNSDNLPVYEPGLDEIVLRNRGKNLHFSSDLGRSIAEADCVFISVNTPTKQTGLGAGKASDLRHLEASARQIARLSQGHTIVVEKSTLPVKSAETVKTVLRSIGKGKTFDVLSNPEFLAEGTAIRDLLNPDRVLIGGESTGAISALAEVYSKWVPWGKIITTNLWSSEMSKLAANAFLAQRVSSINSLSAFCEITGADIDEVSKAIGHDSRIGEKFLKSGPGFGGSCFKKDILNLVYLCESSGLHEVAAYWSQVVIINEWQKQRISRLIVSKLFGTVSQKRIAILGFAFKKDTNDARETPAIRICQDLLIEGAEIVVYDPKVSRETIVSELKNTDPEINLRLLVVDNIIRALNDADAAVFITDWNQFIELDWLKISTIMRHPAWVFDTRGFLESNKILEAGLNYWAVGKPTFSPAN
jgi:UDPglucose 6-dehydrogenase